MCGISGLLDISGNSNSLELEEMIRRMNNAQFHRGPDSDGVWMDRDNGVAFGHRRLAIIDLSANGHQPMVSSAGRFVIVFNGEIYNYKLLQGELIEKGYRFLGDSDTEVIAAAVEIWGIDSMINRLVGMFALAIWDRRDKNLYLFRDRMGEKPLYYGWIGEKFFFSSELGAIESIEDFTREINVNVLSRFMQLQYIPEPDCIYKGIHKLKAGHKLVVSATGKYQATFNEPYWSLDAVIKAGLENPFKGTFDDAQNRLQYLLSQSVESQMRADVPLGAFLSGGIDSSLIVSLMASHSNNSIKTFTVGFDANGYDESPYAEEVAKYLGTDHTTLRVSDDQLVSLAPEMMGIYDEPFADSSQIPTFLISKLTKQHVTVCLSGDGGDELFGGYSRYSASNRLWNRIRNVPYLLRYLLSRTANILPTSLLGSLSKPIVLKHIAEGKRINAGDKAKKLARLLESRSFQDIYRGMTSFPSNQQMLQSEFHFPFTEIDFDGELDHYQYMMRQDSLRYLPGDILTKVDRASMAVSLETRIPFLDHRIVEWAWTLGSEYKVTSNGETKLLPRKLLSKYLPESMIDRPKMGFSVPLTEWLRGPLREWLEHTIRDETKKYKDIFNRTYMLNMLDEHMEGRRDWHHNLWVAAMLVSWLGKKNPTFTGE